MFGIKLYKIITHITSKIVIFLEITYTRVTGFYLSRLPVFFDISLNPYTYNLSLILPEQLFPIIGKLPNWHLLIGINLYFCSMYDFSNVVDYHD